MERKIYLPHTTDSLKECSVTYKEWEVFDYINQESLKLGAIEKEYGNTNPKSLAYIGLPTPKGRIYKEEVYCREIETHDFWNGWSHNSHYEDWYTVFSNEDSIIGALVTTLEDRKDWLRRSNDQNLMFQYFRYFRCHPNDSLDSFFQNVYFPNLSISFESLVPYLKNEKILLDFLELFCFENEEVLEYEEIWQNIMKSIEYFENIAKDCCCDTVKAKKQMLAYFKEQFDLTRKIARKNEKVLSLRK